MFEYTYKYHNYMRNNSPSFGPFYTAFVVAIEQQIENMDKLMGYGNPINSPAEGIVQMGY